MPGRQLDAGLEYHGGRPIYRVRWMTADGRRVDYVDRRRHRRHPERRTKGRTCASSSSRTIPTCPASSKPALGDAGYAVDHAPDGEEAHFLGETEPYDAIVLDLGLPKIDGVSVLERWRRATSPRRC